MVVVKAAEALNGTGYKDHDLYVIHTRVPFNIFRTSKPLVVDAIVSAVSGLSRDSALCTKSLFSHCSARHKFTISRFSSSLSNQV